MIDAFYILAKGDQVVADPDSFHQVERMIDRIGDFWMLLAGRTQKVLVFGCAVLFIRI
jgi:hypothetical protein